MKPFITDSEETQQAYNLGFAQGVYLTLQSTTPEISQTQGVIYKAFISILEKAGYSEEAAHQLAKELKIPY